MTSNKYKIHKKLAFTFKNKSVQRRGLHIAGGIFIGYYFLPPFLPYDIPRTIILYAIIPLVISIELYRWNVREHRLRHLLRDYEKSRPASFSYFAVGSIILLLYFPQYISIPCILSAAICDPIIGITKQKNKQFIGYLTGFLLSSILFILAWNSTTPSIGLTAAMIGASTSMISEYKSSFYIDDDFLMQILPAIVLFIFAYVLKTCSLPLPAQLISSLL
ncbi:MAG: hypothetical protein KGY65_06275 [Candidatus Thermoplasmatota archaeon]|nr:hypothetical protein [Candidatus Thermoplasmatota archaeon]MBS3802339.1 hypothetical protein [Candidatus Thermoplasmatota archaeon]